MRVFSLFMHEREMLQAGSSPATPAIFIGVFNRFNGSNTEHFMGECSDCYRTMKPEKFPVTITEKGVSALIRKTVKVVNSKTLNKPTPTHW